MSEKYKITAKPGDRRVYKPKLEGKGQAGEDTLQSLGYRHDWILPGVRTKEKRWRLKK